MSDVIEQSPRIMPQTPRHVLVMMQSWLRRKMNAHLWYDDQTGEFVLTDLTTREQRRMPFVVRSDTGAQKHQSAA